MNIEQKIFDSAIEEWEGSGCEFSNPEDRMVFNHIISETVNSMREFMAEKAIRIYLLVLDRYGAYNPDNTIIVNAMKDDIKKLMKIKDND